MVAKRKGRKIRAHKVPGHLWIHAGADQVSLLAAEDGDDKELRRYRMVAYTGGLLYVGGWYYPVVIDLAGLALPKKARPNFLNHDPNRIVGHTESIDKTQNRLTADGLISGAGEDARQVVESADNGFPWQSSVGVQVLKALFVEKDTTATANGREFAGPCYIARKSTLFEISFVPLGADDNTSATVNAASAAQYPQVEATDMTFEQWLEAMGLKLADLTEDQEKKLRATFDAEVAETPEAPEGERPEPKPAEAGKPKGGQADPDPLQAQREAAAAEVERQAKIREICAKYQTVCPAGDMAKIEAEAIREKWSIEKAELEAMRADRPHAPAIGSGRPAANSASIEAALCLTAGVREDMLVRSYGERTMEATRSLRGLGLKRAIELAAMLEGRPVPTVFGRDTIRAGFSTVSLPGILSNVANKVLLASFLAVDPVSTRIAGRRSVNDFKAVTSYQLNMTGELEEVGPGGELKSVGFSEESRTNQAKNRGKYVALTYEMIVNDDLGAFEQILRQLARLCAIGREKLVFKTLLANTGNFFHANHRNLCTGAGSALSIGALGLAEQKFLEQKDANGDPIQIVPAITLVPPGLKGTAQEIYYFRDSEELTTANSKKPKGNRYAGAFRVECSPFLGTAAALTNASDTAWYLLAEPNDLPVVEIAYLNGQETPTIESGEVAFDRLGMAWRCIYDFGAALAEWRGGVKSNGA